MRLYSRGTGVGVRNYIALLPTDWVSWHLAFKTSVGETDEIVLFPPVDEPDKITMILEHPNVGGGLIVGNSPISFEMDKPVYYVNDMNNSAIKIVEETKRLLSRLKQDIKETTRREMNSVIVDTLILIDSEVTGQKEYITEKMKQINFTCVRELHVPIDTKENLKEILWLALREGICIIVLFTKTIFNMGHPIIPMIYVAMEDELFKNYGENFDLFIKEIEMIENFENFLKDVVEGKRFTKMEVLKLNTIW